LGSWSGGPVGAGGAYLSDDTARLRDLTRRELDLLGAPESGSQSAPAFDPIWD